VDVAQPTTELLAFRIVRAADRDASQFVDTVTFDEAA